MIQKKSNLVIKIELSGTTYCLTDRDGGISLDGTTYKPLVLSWGNAQFLGNLGNDAMEISTFDVTLNNGEEYSGAGYYFDPTKVWNNCVATVKKWEDGDLLLTDCIPIIKGKIVNHTIDNDKMSFQIDAAERRDGKLLPQILCTDQSDLSDTEAKSTWETSGQANIVNSVANPSIFQAGEMIKLTAPDGTIEYHKIHFFSGADMIVLNNNMANYFSFAAAGTKYIEKAFRNLPDSFAGKTIPIQIGDLSNYAAGEFAKGVTINDKIGEQSILFDYLNLKSMVGVGVWENGLKRFFLAKTGAIITKLGLPNTVEGEYTIAGGYNSIIFKIDTEITLQETLSSAGDTIAEIDVSDAENIEWTREGTDSRYFTNNPDFLGVNVLAIDNELLNIIDPPDTATNTIVAERGYGSTEIADHSIGTKIYQASKYAARGFLLFTERFLPVGICEQYISTAESSVDIIQGSWKALLDTNYSNGIIITFTGTGGGGERFNFNLLFERIENDYPVLAAYVACKMFVETNSAGYIHNYVYFGNFRNDFSYDVSFWDNQADGTYFLYTYGAPPLGEGPDITYYIDTFTSILRTSGPESGSTTGVSIKTGVGTRKPMLDDPYATYLKLNNDPTSIPKPGTMFAMSSLKDLNKRWKVCWQPVDIEAGETSELRLHGIGFWIDFYVKYTETIIMAPLTGRKVYYPEANVTDVCGDDPPTRINDLCENPADVLCHLLLAELEYNTTDFTTSWETVRDYLNDSGNYEILSPAEPCPMVACSYGVDDKRMGGWQFCSLIASHFNLQIIKTYENKVDVINLHQIQNTPGTGYEISIDDILFLADSGQKRMTVKQTGTDLIYNDFVINYRRNNSTNQYQSTYTLPDSYTLLSGVTLSTARTNYYGGEKRTLTIDTPFIYNLQDAQRLAVWRANDQAEVRFFVDFFIDFSHYTDKNSLSEQYKIGDVIYLTGSYSGVAFIKTQKFYIQNITIADSGRELQIQAKSIDPVTSF